MCGTFPAEIPGSGRTIPVWADYGRGRTLPVFAALREKSGSSLVDSHPAVVRLTEPSTCPAASAVG